MHSWNFFIIVCAIPSLLGSLAYSFLPESPKFLMMVGRNDEAMRVFKRIYSLNNGLDPETFPVSLKYSKRPKIFLVSLRSNL